MRAAARTFRKCAHLLLSLSLATALTVGCDKLGGDGRENDVPDTAGDLLDTADGADVSPTDGADIVESGPVAARFDDESLPFPSNIAASTTASSTTR